MPSEIKSAISFSRILDTLRGLSRLEDPAAAAPLCPDFPAFAAHIARLFAEERLFDILPRLEMELAIIKKHSPRVRPALDPYVSTQIGIFSRRFSDLEVGSFLGYPSCCMRPFAEEARYGLDERHSAELKLIAGKIFVTTAGFIPHSVFCTKSQMKGLIAFVSREELERMRLLEKEMALALPHAHPEYQGQYYEVRIT